VIVVPFIGFAVIALAAIGFATFTLWRRKVKGGALLAGAIALFLLGIGGGTYWMVGRPSLATRAAQGLSVHNVGGLVPYLIARVRQQPGDLQAWIFLARAYVTVGDNNDAAKAYGRAVTVARLAHKEDPDLDAAYGEALVAAEGQVSDDAMEAFSNALKLDPKNPPAQYYLGQAKAERGDKQGALAQWQNLLAEVPANAPLHQALVDRMALLTAQNGGGGGPDPKAMVAGLAARLKDNPNDAAGWQRLIRAYTVLGQRGDAQNALATARKTFANDKDTMAALESEATELKLN
jgi:cytochrome c-type biogenesis protein CcmH